MPNEWFFENILHRYFLTVFNKNKLNYLSIYSNGLVHAFNYRPKTISYLFQIFCFLLVINYYLLKTASYVLQTLFYPFFSPDYLTRKFYYLFQIVSYQIGEAGYLHNYCFLAPFARISLLKQSGLARNKLSPCYANVVTNAF